MCCGVSSSTCKPSRLTPEPRGSLESEAMSDTARVVVIGGGIWGGSIAYHLARARVFDVLVLELRELASGNTSHAAGLVGQLRGSELIARSILAVVGGLTPWRSGC